MPVNKVVSQYLARIGRKGGLRSRRVLDPAVAKNMVRVREARRLFKKHHAQCFWSFDPDYHIQLKDVSWVATQLMKQGNRELWLKGKALCR